MAKKNKVLPQDDTNVVTKRVNPYNQFVTLGEHLRYLLPEPKSSFPQCPRWPADVFAAAASLLARAGGYSSVLNSWPPPATGTSWVEDVRELGTRWRRDWKKTPTEIRKAWVVLELHELLPLHEICKTPIVLDNLVLLSSAADETCAKVGLPIRWKSLSSKESDFYLKATQLVLPKRRGSTLCERINPTRVRVLPKMHTPQSGMTIRSLSLNLALITSDEIVPKWHQALRALNETLNVLVLPWPFTIPDNAIRPCAPLAHELENMSSDFGFFTYAPSQDEDPTDLITRFLNTRGKNDPRPDVIVLPELALTPAQFDSLAAVTRERQILLVAGVCVDDGHGKHPRNEARFADYVMVPQQKHHRWKLNSSQIAGYGIEKQLDPAKDWWEHIDISSREFNFMALGDGLVVSALICEDLARPDPVGDILRAVGPNVVFALLMDGPQVMTRWPGRYVASLADDPGSSVLSVTSLGMSLRSKVPAGKIDRGRTVALWQSPEDRACEIELPLDANAVLLTLERKKKKEWVVDGRDDRGEATYFHLKSSQMLALR